MGGEGSTCCGYDCWGEAIGAFIIIGGGSFWASIGMVPNIQGVLYTCLGSWV